MEGKGVGVGVEGYVKEYKSLARGEGWRWESVLHSVGLKGLNQESPREMRV